MASKPRRIASTLSLATAICWRTVSGWMATGAVADGAGWRVFLAVIVHPYYITQRRRKRSCLILQPAAPDVMIWSNSPEH
jgi:hypothetical protein